MNFSYMHKKFGSSVQDHHTYILCNEEILADFNLAVGRKTTNHQNLRQIFQLYGISLTFTNVVFNSKPVTTGLKSIGCIMIASMSNLGGVP